MGLKTEYVVPSIFVKKLNVNSIDFTDIACTLYLYVPVLTENIICHEPGFGLVTSKILIVDKVETADIEIPAGLFKVTDDETEPVTDTVTINTDIPESILKDSLEFEPFLEAIDASMERLDLTYEMNFVSSVSFNGNI